LVASSSSGSSPESAKKRKVQPSQQAMADAAAVRAAIAMQKSGGDDVFVLPGQLHDNKFVLRSRELRLSERVSKKILILEVVEDLCASLYLQQTPGISRVIVGDKGLDTEGANMDIFWAIDEIQHAKIRTNDIALMLDRYGVEACRLSIVNEISRVFGHYGISVDRRHLSLIADYMTHQGGYRPFNRAGMTAHSSPFLKMTFETSVNFLTAACQEAQKDNLKSPAGALVLGKLAPIGTGVFSLRNEKGVKALGRKVPFGVKSETDSDHYSKNHFVFDDDEDEDEDQVMAEDEEMEDNHMIYEEDDE
jgi:DNA-directed RNA polymerase I subunit RPA1